MSALGDASFLWVIKGDVLPGGIGSIYGSFRRRWKVLSGKLLSCVKLAFYVTGVKSSRLTPLNGQCVQFHTKLDDVSKALVELQKESSRLGGPCGFLRSLAGFAGEEL